MNKLFIIKPIHSNRLESFKLIKISCVGRFKIVYMTKCNKKVKKASFIAIFMSVAIASVDGKTY